ncbi:MAG TPA: DUF3443 domain-containing protein [Nitrospira sp.]|nr:DUF3443 domain-containing protein [Nitrospira sp.]
MTCVRGTVVMACWCLLTACGSDNSGNNTPSTPANALTVSIGASSVCTNVNEPCTAVTVCQPGTSTCQIISDLLVDVGSVGLRIFRSVLSTSLSQAVDSQGRALGECVFFADGGTEWGPVQIADVVLGGSPPARVPVHVIDPTFAGQSASQNPCNSTVDSDPQATGFNGIIGLGLFRQDCGPVCANNDNNNLYFACAANSCTSTAVPLSGQVQNPVWLLPVGNNGIVMSLPNVPATGAATASGSLLIGIGTGTNNMPAAGVSVLTTDANGVLTTVYKGKTIGSSIIDSGSNGLFFPDTSIPSCAAPLQAFYCPPNSLNLSATIVGTNGRQIAVPFQVANTQSLVQTGNAAFNNLGGELSVFDWGLPFFLGRTVYIGIEGQSSPLGTGPLFAF